MITGRQCSRLSADQGVADPGNDAIPLTFLGRGVIDQHAVDEVPGKVQRLYQIFALLKLDTTKKRGVTL